MGAYDALFEPFELKGLTLKNRIISTPHGPAYADRGLPLERYQAYHEEKAKGGLAMTMFGGSSNVSIDSPSMFGQLYLGDDEIVPHLKAFSARIHGHGAALMCQITHMGHRAVWDVGNWLPPVSASHVRDEAHRAFPKAMESFDIERVIADYGRAARRCRDGGLDGIEIALAGHLPNQFLSPRMNRREDDYGGSLENRLRFLLEVLGEVRRRAGDDYIVGLRYPADELLEGGLDARECIETARLIEESGLADFLDVYAGSPSWDPIFVDHIPGMSHPLTPYFDAVGALRQSISLPVFHATRIIDLTSAARAVNEGVADLVGMTRAHMTDPHIVAKLQRGEEERIRPCVGANYCIDRIYMGGEALCLHNPATGREETMPQVIAPGDGAKLKVVVVGAGPGGLEASRVAAQRGHEVVLFEAASEPGGQVAIAARATWRRDLSGIIGWLAREVELAGVDLCFNTLAEADDVLAENPDVVIVATGGLPDTDRVEGAVHVVSSWDVLTGQVAPAAEVLVFDELGDHQALTCADVLADKGARVELITPDRAMGAHLGISNHGAHARRFERLGITVTPNSRVVSVARDGGRLRALVRNDFGGAEATRQVDLVVVEHGTEPVDDLYHALKPGARNGGEVDLAALVEGHLVCPETNGQGCYRLFRIGDAVSSRNIHAALFDALRICKDL